MIQSRTVMSSKNDKIIKGFKCFNCSNKYSLYLSSFIKTVNLLDVCLNIALIQNINIRERKMMTSFVSKVTGSEMVGFIFIRRARTIGRYVY